jgi:hypothetical protein
MIERGGSRCKHRFIFWIPSLPREPPPWLIVRGAKSVGTPRSVPDGQRFKPAPSTCFGPSSRPHRRTDPRECRSRSLRNPAGQMVCKGLKHPSLPLNPVAGLGAADSPILPVSRRPIPPRKRVINDGTWAALCLQSIAAERQGERLPEYQRRRDGPSDWGQSPVPSRAEACGQLRDDASAGPGGTAEQGTRPERALHLGGTWYGDAFPGTKRPWEGFRARQTGSLREEHSKSGKAPFE